MTGVFVLVSENQVVFLCDDLPELSRTNIWVHGLRPRVHGLRPRDFGPLCPPERLPPLRKHGEESGMRRLTANWCCQVTYMVCVLSRVGRRAAPEKE